MQTSSRAAGAVPHLVGDMQVVVQCLRPEYTTRMHQRKLQNPAMVTCRGTCATSVTAQLAALREQPVAGAATACRCSA